MKQLRAHRTVIHYLLIALIAFWQIGQPLQAATFYWDTDTSTDTNDGATGTGLGGTGNWDLATSNWWSLSSLGLWPNTNADTAIFSGPFSALPTLRTVTLSSSITANQLRFMRSGYTLTGGSLTLAGTGAGIYAQMAESATISSGISGTDGLLKTGGGSIRLTGTNTYTGATTIAGGTLIINSAAALGGTGTVNITAGNGTPSNVLVLGFTGGSLLLDGSAVGFNLARDLNLEGRGPIGQNGAALLSIGNNTISGVVTTASSAQTPATFRNTRISSVNGTLTLSGTLNVLGTAGTTITTLGGGNQSGVGNYSLTGILSGTGTLEKSGSGTLFLNPSVTSGFAGRLRVSGSAASGQSSVLVTSLNDGANTTSVFGTANGTTTSAPIDMNGGVLEIRSDASLNFGKNVYQRAASTIFVGQAVGGAGVNGTVTFGNMSFEDNIAITFNSRNGYGVSFTTAPVNGGDNGTTITNNMGGNLSFTGNFWSNADNAAARTMTIGGNGNTVINGNVIAAAAAFDHILTKTGSGALTITGTGSTLDGAVNVQGSLIITDFRSITNNTSSITLGNATTTVGNLIIGTATAPSAGGLTTSKPIVLNGTTAVNSIYANQTGGNPVILNGAITKPVAGNSGLILGGTNTADNIINVGIPALGTGGVTKLGDGTWVLAGTNLYTGATTIANGTLKLKANAASSTIIADTSAITFNANATTGSAGGTLHFTGVNGAATTESLGALTATAGPGKITLESGGGGAAANLTFASLGATTAASSVNFDTTSAGGGLVTLTGQAATSATNLPGTANFQGHLYLNGADFATINGSAQVVAPTYAGAGNFQNALSALVASVHNKLTGSFTNGALTVSSLVTNSQTLTLSGNLVVSTGGILQSGGTATIKSDSATDRLINQTGTAGTNVAIRVNLSGDVLNLGATGALVNIGSFTTGGLTKNGAGLLNILGTNAQTGTTNINEGTVRLSGTAARLAATSANLVIRQDAALQLNGTTGANATVAALDGAGTITNMDAAAITFTQTGAGTWNGIFQDGTGVLNVTKAGTTGAPTWTGLNTYTGVTTIGGTTGLVTVDTLANGGVASGIGASTSAASNLVFAGTTAGLVYQGNILDGALTLGSRSASTDRLFTLSGSGATLSSTVSNNNAIVWSNTGAIVHGTNADRTLIFDGTSTGDNTFNPLITNSTGFVTSVTKNGAGQWNLGNSSNSYTGATTITNGTLALNNNGALTTTSPLLLAPSSATSVAVFQMSGTFERSLAATTTAGSGTVTFGGTIASTTGGVGFAAHTTALTVAIGGVSTPTALTWGSGGFVGTAFAQNLVLNSSTALSSVDFRNAIDFGTAQRTVNVLDNGNTGADFAILSGVLSGTSAGGLRKIGTGILKVTGANTYTGVTDHNAGTLIVSSLGNSTSTAGTATSVGISGIGITFDNTNAITIGNGGTSGAIFVYAGAGEVSDRKIRLNNTTSTTAGVQIHADGSGPLILTNLVNDMQAGAKRLYLRGTNNAGNMITSQLSDNGGALELVIDSNATWILTNSANNFTGTTTVSAGALGIGHDTAVGGAILNSNGNIFAYGGDRTVSNTMTMNNNANWGFLGDYNLTFANAVLGSSANSNTLFNSIVAGKALTFNGLVANGLTATRNFTVDGPGETIINGNFTTSTSFGVQIIKTGDGTLTLGGDGMVSNWNQVGTGIDVDRGTLKFITNNAINSTVGYAGVTLSPEIVDGDTATVDLNGTNQTVNALTANSNGTIVIDNTAATAASFRFGANNSTVNFGSGIGTYTFQNTGVGALSLVKLGNTTTSFISGITLAHKGVTASEGGGVFNIASPVTATTGLRAIEGSALNLSGGLPNGNLVTSIEVGGGSTLSLLDGAGSQFSNLTTLSLGNTGTGTVTLNLNIGDLTTSTDRLNTDTLTLVTTGTLNLGNTITFNMTDAGLNALQTYTLLNVVDGGLSAYGFANLLQGATPGGFDSFTWNVTNNLVQITTGNLIVGDLYWRGVTDSTWNANANNWSTDKAGTTPAASIPGQGSKVIFAYDGVAAGDLITTLEQNFKINALVFEAGATTPASVTINAGANAASRLEIAPGNSANGIAITAGGPAAATIGANLKIGTNQTWNVVDSGTTLTLSGALFGEADVTKTGAGRVVLSGIADPTFNSGVTTDFTISGGNLEVTNLAALGTAANSNLARVNASSGGGFYYNNATAGTVVNALTLSGGTLSGGGANHTYSGAVNVSADSFINMGDSNGPATNAARNITLSGAVSGSGSLTIDGNNTTSSGNQIGGTLTFNNIGNTWSGNLLFNRGTVTLGAAASTSFTANNVTFSSFGRLILQGTNGVTLTRSGTLSYAAGSVGEFQVDNTSGTLGANYLVSQNGAVTLGTGGTGASVRVFLADAASALDIAGGVTLGGNSSISVAGGDANSFMTISGVITDGSNSYGLSLNDDAGGWGQTNTLVHLANANTYDGGTTLAGGTLRMGSKNSLGTGGLTVTANSTLSVSTNLTGANAVTNALTLNANLAMDGDFSLELTSAIDLGAVVRTFTANGATGTQFILSGAITNLATADGSALILAGNGIGSGLISGGFTQTGTTADASVTSGAWTFAGAVSTVADDLTVSGTTTSLTLNSAGVLDFGGGSNVLQITNGAVVNLGASGTMTGFADLGLYIAQGAGGAVATFNMNSFNQSVLRLILGERAADREGVINGAGTLTVDGTTGFELYSGTINANLASTGTTPFNKYGPGIVTLKGDNSGIGTTTAAIVNEGTLVLDYTASNTTKLRVASALEMRGGNLVLNGNTSSATSQTVTGFVLDSSASDDNAGANTITLNPASGQDLVLNLGAVTRTATNRDGTIRFVLPSGTQTATNGITTSTNTTNGILGGFATVEDGTGTWFATKTGNNITALASTAKNSVATWQVGEHITDTTTGFTGTLAFQRLNSLRFDAAGGSAVNLSAGGVLNIATGGVLITDQVTSGSPGIFGGSLSSGINELIITQDSAQVFEISSSIGGAHAVTKSGVGTLKLSGNNFYTDETEILQGILQVSGGNAIGDNSTVSLAANRNTTLQLLADETIGLLQGGRRGTNSDYGTVAIGSHTLTINESASTTYAGFFTGDGAIVMNTGSTGNLQMTNNSSGFTGAVVINGGLFYLNAGGRIAASSITINKGGNLLLAKDGTTRSADQVADTAVIILNSADGGFSGATINRPRGLGIRTDQDSTNTEVVGVVTANSGANYVTLEATTANDDPDLRMSNLVRNNSATLNVRGTVLGLATANVTRSQFEISNATNETAFIGTLVGGGGATGTQNISIVPWAIGESFAAALGDLNMGNSLVTYAAASGFRSLDFTTEYDTIAAAAVTDNARAVLTTDLIGLAGTTVNALVLHNDSTSAVTHNVTGTGAGQTLAITSGALLFTLNTAAATGAYGINLGGFDGGITVGGTNEYVIHVIDPSSAATPPTLTATIASALASVADITKSGRGTLVLSGSNTAGGNTRKTTINEGILEITDLDNIGGGTGGVVFAGGTLRLGAGFADDISTRTISFLQGGGTIDTQGTNFTLSNSVGSGVGGLTKIGTGTLTFVANATYTGTTTVANGRLVLNGGGNNRLSTSAALVVGSGTTSGVVQFGDAINGASNQTVSSLATSGTGTTNAIVGGNADLSTLTVDQSIATTYAGVIGGAGSQENNIALVKAGGGILTLTGASTFTGGVTIKAGTLVAGNAATALGDASTVITLGDTAGSANATLNFQNTLTYANAISVIAGSSGALTLLGGNATTGAPTLSGAITLSNNLVIAKQGTTGAFTLSGGITGTGNVVIENMGTTGTIALTTNAVNHAGSLTHYGYATGTTTISADIGSNVTSIIQNSSMSAFTLSGANIAFTGGITVNAGVLNITGGATTGPTPNALTVAGGGTLNLLNTVGQHFNLGAGVINLGAGSGTATLSLELGGSGNYDRFSSSGTAVTANNVVLNLTGLSGFGAGNYDLIAAGSGLSGATYSLGTLGGSLVGSTLALNVNDTLVQLAASASSGNFHWDGAINTSWTGISGLNTNWTSDLAGDVNANGTPGAASSVIFSSEDITGTALATTLDGAFTIQDLTFNNQVGSGPLATLSITAGTGGTLTTAPASPTAGINVQSGAPVVTISAPVILGASQTWTNGSAGLLTVSGGVTGAFDLALSATSTGGITLSTGSVNNVGTVTNSGGGTGGVTISGIIGTNVTGVIQNSATSALTLGGVANTWTGGLTIKAGSVLGGNNANTFGDNANVITLGDTTGSADTLLRPFNSATYMQQIVVKGGNTGMATLMLGTTTGSVIWGGAITLDTHDLTIAKQGTTGTTQVTGGITGTGNLTIDNDGTSGTIALATAAIDHIGTISNVGSATGTTTISASIGGNVTDVIQNSAASGLTLSGTNTFTGGVDLLAGTLTLGSTTALGVTGGAFTITGGTTLNSSVANLVNANNNAIIINGDFTFTGTQSLDLGTGAVSLGSTAGARQITVTANALTLGGIISDGTATALTKAGAGTLILAANNSYTGATTISAGTLQLGTGGTSGGIGATLGVVSNGTLAINRSDNVTQSLLFGNVSGTGSISKLAAGTLVLDGANTHTGNITVSGGTLNITGTWTGNTTSSTLAFGGTVASTIVNVSNNITAFGLTGGNANGAVAVYNQTAGTANLTGNISAAVYVANALGSYGYFNITGGTLKVANRFAFNTTTSLVGQATSVVYVGGNGFLDLTNSEWSLNYSHGHLTVADNGVVDRSGATSPYGIIMNSTVAGSIYGVLNVAGGSFITTTQPIRFGNSTTAGNGNNNTALINLGAGTLQVGVAMTTSLPSAGANNAYVNFAGGTLKTSANVANWIPTAASGITFTTNLYGLIDNSALSGAPSFAGGLVFDSNGFDSSLGNALLGATGNGVVQSSLTVVGGSGYIGAPEVVFTGGTLAAGGSPAAGYALISGGVVTGVVITSPGSYTVAPTVTLTGGGGTGASVTVGTLVANTSGGLSKIGDGILTLSGANTYTGGTTVTGGTLALGANDVMANAGNVTVNGGIFNMASFNDTVATVSLQSGSIIGSTGILTSTADFDLRSGSASAILAGAVGVNKTTAGIVTLSGANTFGGAVNITGGVLSVAASNHLGNAAATNTLSINGGALRYTGAGTVDLATNRVLTIGVAGATLDATSSTGVLQITGGISGGSTGNLTKTGVGTVFISNATSLNGGAGAVTVSDGRLNASFGTGGVSSITVGATGSLTFHNNSTESLAGLTLLNLNGGGRLGFDIAATGSNDSLSLGVSSTLTVTGSVLLDLLNIGGLGVGAYTLISDPNLGLSLANFSLGNVTGFSGFLPSLSIANGGQNLVLNVTAFTPIYWDVSSAGSWATATNWSTDLAGDVPAAASPVSADTVVFSSDDQLSNSFTTTLDGSYTVNGLQFTSQPGTITGITIAEGTGGTLTLAPSSSISGIEVLAGSGNNIISAPVIASTAQTWTLESGTSLTLSGNVAFNGAVTKTGTGALTLSGVGNTGLGGFTLSGGLLNLNASNVLGTGTFTIAPGTTINAGAGGVVLNNASQLWNGNFSFTGSNNLDLGAGAVTLGGNVILTASGSILTVGGGIDDGASTFGLVKDGAGVLILNGTNSYDGLTSLMVGTLTLAGNNSGAAGGVTMTAGTTLNIGDVNALGTGIFTINGGTLNTSGGAIVNAGVNSMAWNGSFTFTGANNLDLGAGAVTLGATPTVTVSASTLTVGGVISGSFGLTKAGAGTLTLSGLSVTAASNFSGTTILDGGTTNITTTDAALEGGFTFGASSASANTSTLNINNRSVTFQGALLSQTNSATANTLAIGTGSLVVNGNVAVGAAGSGTNGRLTVTGTGGTWNVNGGNLTFRVGGSSTAASTSILNTTGLTNFTSDLGALGALRLGSSDGGAVADTVAWQLGATSLLKAGTLDIGGNTTHAGMHTLTLGSGVTTINANTIDIGSREGTSTARRGSGALNFASPTDGSIVIRTYNGTGAIALNLINSVAQTNTAFTADLLLAGHSADVLVSTLVMASRAPTASTTTTSSTATLTFDQGTFTTTGATTLGSRGGSSLTTGDTNAVATFGGGTVSFGGAVTMGNNSASTATSAGVSMATLTFNGSGSNTITGNLAMGTSTISGASAVNDATENAVVKTTLNVAGSASLTITGALNMAVNSGTAALTNATTAMSTANISGGSVSVTGNISMGNTTANALNIITNTLNLTGGSLTVGGNITYTNGVGTENVILNLQGGLLDMTDGSIGASGALITFNAESGTLRNLAQLNGGGTLTKTTVGTLVMDAANSYTGATVVSAGILAISHGGALGGTTNGTSVAAGGTLALSGGITVSGESLTLTADSTANNASLSNASGSNTWSGSLSVDTGTGSGRALLESAAGSNLLVSGNINIAAGSNDFVLRGDGNGEISGQIMGTQRLFKSSVGAGTWILSGNNSTTFTGRTSIGNGTIEISSESNLGAAPASFVANQLTLGGGSSNGTLRTTASTDLSANRGVTLGAVGGTFETAATTTLTVNGVIAGTTGALNKTGAGTLVLTAANTYAGTTNVSAGTLQVGNGSTGSLDGAGGVNVTGSGSKLSGSGSIVGSTILGSGTILAPGLGDTDGSNQTLNFTAVEVQNGGQVQLSITSRTEQLGSSDMTTLIDALAGGSYTSVVALFTGGQLNAYKTTAPGNHDFINISGTFTINADNLATPLFKVANRTGFPYTTAAPSVGDVFNLMDWTTLSFSGTNSSLTEANFDFSGAGFTGEFKFDTSAFATHGILVVVPEPSRAFFILLGLLGLLMRRRRAL